MMQRPEFEFWSAWIVPLLPTMFEKLLEGVSEERVKEAAWDTFNVMMDLVNESPTRGERMAAEAEHLRRMLEAIRASHTTSDP